MDPKLRAGTNIIISGEILERCIENQRQNRDAWPSATAVFGVRGKCERAQRRTRRDPAETKLTADGLTLHQQKQASQPKPTGARDAREIINKLHFYTPKLVRKYARNASRHGNNLLPPPVTLHRPH